MTKQKSIWVFGDYRNYFQNRVTLQLLSKAVDLAGVIGAEVCAVVVGHNIEEWIMEYTAHGADRILSIDHPSLTSYSTEHYLALMQQLVTQRDPDIILIGATDFGREFAPRLAKRLQTGLSADCVGLDITPEGLLIQTAPSFGGNMLAEIVTEMHRPQMATVRPRTFAIPAPNPDRRGRVTAMTEPKAETTSPSQASARALARVSAVAAPQGLVCLMITAAGASWSSRTASRAASPST